MCLAWVFTWVDHICEVRQAPLASCAHINSTYQPQDKSKLKRLHTSVSVSGLFSGQWCYTTFWHADKLGSTALFAPMRRVGTAFNICGLCPLLRTGFKNTHARTLAGKYDIILLARLTLQINLYLEWMLAFLCSKLLCLSFFVKIIPGIMWRDNHKCNNYKPFARWFLKKKKENIVLSGPTLTKTMA